MQHCAGPRHRRKRTRTSVMSPPSLHQLLVQGLHAVLLSIDLWRAGRLWRQKQPAAQSNSRDSETHWQVPAKVSGNGLANTELWRLCGDPARQNTGPVDPWHGRGAFSLACEPARESRLTTCLPPPPHPQTKATLPSAVHHERLAVG